MFCSLLEEAYHVSSPGLQLDSKHEAAAAYVDAANAYKKKPDVHGKASLRLGLEFLSLLVWLFSSWLDVFVACIHHLTRLCL